MVCNLGLAHHNNRAPCSYLFFLMFSLLPCEAPIRGLSARRLQVRLANTAQFRFHNFRFRLFLLAFPFLLVTARKMRDKLHNWIYSIAFHFYTQSHTFLLFTVKQTVFYLFLCYFLCALHILNICTTHLCMLHVCVDISSPART